MPGPAAMPKYQRIAAALRQELARAEHGPGGKLPSERSLAARYGVNRQTIRAALQQLRADGLVVTGKRGTRRVPAAADPATPAPTGINPATPAAKGTDPATPAAPAPASRRHAGPASRSSPCRRPSPRRSGCAAGSGRSSTTTANWARRGRPADRR